VRVGDDRRQRHRGVRAEHRDRAREHEARSLAAGVDVGAQGIQQRTRAVDVGAQAEIEVGLAFARDGGGEVEHAVERLLAQCVGVHQQRAGARRDPRVGQQVGGWRGDVGQHHLADVAPAQVAAR
jgi:hypothetical protein